MEKKILVELKHVSKRFAKVLANDVLRAFFYTNRRKGVKMIFK